MGMSDAFSSGKIPKLIGGIKVYMHADAPVDVLVMMNYSTTDGAKYIDTFTLYVHRKIRHVVMNGTEINAHWRRGKIDKEIKLQKNRIYTGVRKNDVFR